MNKNTTADTLYLLIPSITYRINLDYWIGYISNKIELEKIVKTLKNAGNFYLSNKVKVTRDLLYLIDKIRDNKTPSSPSPR